MISFLNHYYLIHIQYLGFRFHGWAKQPAVKTVHHMIDRTLSYVFEEKKYKTLGGSRTDAMVSANHFAFELFVTEPLDEEVFLKDFNLNLPADIRAIAIEQVDETFNIIQNPRTKEYIYLFAFGEKPHPFSAPFVCTLPDDLNIELMQQGAKLFEGAHHFGAYCKKPNERTQVNRSVDLSEIRVNELLTASFFPQNTYTYHVSAKGFLRNQIRIMIGQLFRLGRGEISLEYLERSLRPDFEEHLSYIAPASGLMLHKIDFDR
ncbi:MAG: tRNA pseudouridine(38-40) synthase TruA [Roseivirga sp.]